MISKTVHLEINPDLWKDFKTACAYYDISMKATLIKHIQNIVNDYRKGKAMSGEWKVDKKEDYKK